MTYNVFGGTLNPTLLLSRRMLILSHFHLYGELRFPGVMGRQDYSKKMMMIESCIKSSVMCKSVVEPSHKSLKQQFESILRLESQLYTMECRNGLNGVQASGVCSPRTPLSLHRSLRLRSYRKRFIDLFATKLLRFLDPQSGIFKVSNR